MAYHLGRGITAIIPHFQARGVLTPKSYLEDISLAKEKILSQRGLIDAIDARLDKLAAEQKGGKEPGSMA